MDEKVNPLAYLIQQHKKEILDVNQDFVKVVT